jgi:hypothetical protein
MPRPVVAKNPWGRRINHRNSTAPKGQNEIAQGRAKRRPGYISALISEPLGSALSGLGMIRAHRTQGVALGYHLAPRWGKRPLDRIPSIIVVFGISVGDTITVLVNRKPLKIRIEAIDAPKSRQRFGNRSTQALSDSCSVQRAFARHRIKAIVTEQIFRCDRLVLDRSQIITRTGRLSVDTGGNGI